MKQDYTEMKTTSQTVSQLKDFVKKLNSLPEMTRHINLAQHLSTCTSKPSFLAQLDMEHTMVEAQSYDIGSVQWKIKLEGRVECSAAIIGDFSQVVVGCYKGKIYFIDSSNGNILWSFQTSSEVKSQPLVDIPRQLIWCGSHDHNLYALDYKNHCCVYKFPCGGSIYGSPVIDEVNNTLYVASTTGQMTAISVKQRQHQEENPWPPKDRDQATPKQEQQTSHLLQAPFRPLQEIRRAHRPLRRRRSRHRLLTKRQDFLLRIPCHRLRPSKLSLRDYVFVVGRRRELAAVGEFNRVYREATKELAVVKKRAEEMERTSSLTVQIGSEEDKTKMQMSWWEEKGIGSEESEHYMAKLKEMRRKVTNRLEELMATTATTTTTAFHGGNLGVVGAGGGGGGGSSSRSFGCVFGAGGGF